MSTERDVAKTNKKIDRDVLKISLGKRVKMHDRDKMVIECLLKMATDTKLNWMQLSAGDCMVSVDRDENGIISIHDYKPFRFGYSHD